jgi:hypothetical protein
MGCEQSNNAESRLFQSLNKEILDWLGACWAHVEDLPSTQELLKGFPSLEHYVVETIKRELVPRHIGCDISHDALQGVRWGWKDPRNCLTLPIYRRIFPSAVLVYVFRDVRYVAASLLRRQEKHRGPGFSFGLGEARKRYAKYVELWEHYNSRALDMQDQFPLSVTVYYENFVANPVAELKRVLKALNIDVTREMSEFVGDIREDRKGGFTGATGSRFDGMWKVSEVYRRLYPSVGS